VVPSALTEPPLQFVPEGTGPLVAICMAAHEPNDALFQRQLESIRRQTHQRFVCVISDDASSSACWTRIRAAAEPDPRFFCTRSSKRLGFYRNFERALSFIPAEAEFVALADQDDRWHPDKIAVLTHALRTSGAMLAYSDMNIVSDEGALLAPSSWTERRNNFTDLRSLLLMNSVTGSASLLRRQLLVDALPFPPEVGRPYHDHWLACVALAGGEIAYTDRTLLDYVQHAANVAGRYTASSDFESGLLRALKRFAADPRRRFRSTLDNASRMFLEDVLRLEIFARTLEARLGPRIAPGRRADVARFANLSTSYRALIWLLGHSTRDLAGDSPTLGAENQLVKGIAWARLQTGRTRVGL
jgi:glycosyltransferase involved in cell wall biosynthesis